MFEKFPGYQQAGALLGLAPNAQKALHAIDPALLEAVEATAVPDGRSISFDNEGAHVADGLLSLYLVHSMIGIDPATSQPLAENILGAGCQHSTYLLVYAQATSWEIARLELSSAAAMRGK